MVLIDTLSLLQLSSGIDGLRQYNEEVKAGAFPSEKHTYKTYYG